MSRENAVLNTKDAAMALSVTEWWARQLIARGELRAINIGGCDKAARWRVDPEDLSAFMVGRENRSRDLVSAGQS